MQIFCERPKFIFNPAAKSVILSCGKYTLSNGELTTLTPSLRAQYHFQFPYSIFSSKKYNLTIENSDSYYCLTSDGECIPLFLPIPCRKCLLCRKKTASEWSFRAVAETQYSNCVPYFVTLTYDNNTLPADGVNKKDIQLFLKRLRANLYRKHNYLDKIRYFAVSEYGSKTHRAHYHLILWNMPNTLNSTAILHLIQDAWSLKRRTYNSLTKSYDWELIQRIGFAYVRPCNVGGIQYVMKYMRKPPYIPSSKNETFFLSSRREGGIGAKWCKEHTLWFYEHPDVIHIDIVDKYTGERLRSTIPSYFRRKLYPSASVIVDKSVRDAIFMLDYFLTIRQCHYKFINFNYSDNETFFIRSEIKRLFPFYQPYTSVNRFPTYILNNYRFLRQEHGDDLFFYVNSVIDGLWSYVQSNPMDVDYYRRMTACRDVYHQSLALNMSDLPELDITYVKYTIENALIVAIEKECI